MSKQDEQLKSLSNSIEKMQRESEKSFPDTNGNSLKSTNQLWQFFIGVMLFGVGLFCMLSSADSRTEWFRWGFNSWVIPNVTIIIPILIGICMMFFMKQKIYGGIVTFLGFVIFMLTIIISTAFSFNNIYFFVFGMMVVGIVLLLRAFLKRK